MMKGINKQIMVALRSDIWQKEKNKKLANKIEEENNKVNPECTFQPNIGQQYRSEERRVGTECTT